jgi:hypothetical protein
VTNLKQATGKDLLAACSSGLKMEGRYSYEISVDFQQTVQCYVPEDRTLYAGFEVFTVVDMESPVILDKMLYNLLKVCVLPPSSVFFDHENRSDMFL